jgi:hypothetical protein
MAEGILLPTDGALECLLALHADGLRLALASSATRSQVQLVVDKLGIRRLLGALVSADDVARGKPAPDIFLAAASKLGVRRTTASSSRTPSSASRRRGPRAWLPWRSSPRVKTPPPTCGLARWPSSPRCAS